MDALLELGGAYAALEPIASSATSQVVGSFLNTLYEATGERAIQQGRQELGSFVENFNSKDYLISS